MKPRPLPQRLRRLAALARAGQAWTDLPPELSAEYQGWLEAARQSNHPERLLLRLAAHCEAAENLRQEVLRSLLYPRLVLVGLGLLVMGLSAAFWSPLLVVVLLLCVLAYWASGRSDRVWSWLGARRLAYLEQVLWCGNLAQLLELEMDLPSACKWAALPIQDAGVRAQASALEKPLAEGSGLAEAIQPYGWAPLISWAASAGEQHQTLAGALREAAKTLESDLEEEMNRTLAWLQPAALALVGSLMLIAIGSFWLNYQTISLEALR